MIKKKYGRVVFLGRPNTGKSTLLNAIMDQKVAITSPLPQTSRKNQRVLYRCEKGKIIFSDTPGIMNKIVDLVGKKSNAEAPRELVGASLLVVMVDISREKNEEENKVIGLARKMTIPKILVYNKVDKAVGSKDHKAEYLWMEEEFDKTIEISALKGQHVKGLLNIIFELLPEKIDKELVETVEMMDKKKGPMMGMTSNEYIEEIIREKAYLSLRQEVPYSISVELQGIKEKKAIIVIEADILTTADRYKKMIIGKEGKKIKQIGSLARKELELAAGKKVFLALRVRVDKHWPERAWQK